MEVLKSINSLKEMSRNAKKLPMSDMVLINKYDLLEVLEDIRKKLPLELEEAERLLGQRNMLLQEAKMEADAIIKEAEQGAKQLLAEHEITKKAQATSEEVTERARLNAKELKNSAKEYSLTLLNDLEEQLELSQVRLVKNLEDNYNAYIKFINHEYRDKVESIKENIEELKKYK